MMWQNYLGPNIVRIFSLWNPKLSSNPGIKVIFLPGLLVEQTTEELRQYGQQKESG